LQRSRTGQKLVEQHSERKNVAARVDIQAAHFRLFGAHVSWRTDHLPVSGKQRFLRKLLTGRLGDTEVDDLWHWFAIVQCHQDIGWLQIAMDDPLLVRMLDRMANIAEES